MVRVSVGEEGDVKGLKMEKAQEPTVEGLMWGTWRLRVSSTSTVQV